MAKVEFIDETLRDAQQSLWATRMTREMMVPIARTMDRAGFSIINLAGGAVFDSCLMYLNESPWERLSAMSNLMPNTPINFITRGQTIWGWRLVADDVIRLTLQCVAKRGIRSLMIFDPLNDMRNMRVSIQTAKEVGLYVMGALSFTLSPVHTDAYYEERTRELMAMGVDAVMLKDPSALLTVERTRSLVPLLKRIIGGKAKLQVHTHCMTGQGEACYFEAVRHGADVVYTSTSPLAGGDANPATQDIVRGLTEMGYDVPLDRECLQEMEDYFSLLAYKEKKPVGRPKPYDPKHYEHQVPGGMISNLVQQLTDLGLKHRLPEVMDEIVRIRQELAYPIMISPLAQYVGVQATLNVVSGDRYSTVTDEIKKYALGYYGALAAPIEPNVLDKIAGKDKPITKAPGELLEPMLDKLRSEIGPNVTDENLLLHIFYSRVVLDKYFQQMTERKFTPSCSGPLEELIKELAKRDNIKTFSLSKGSVNMTMIK